MKMKNIHVLEEAARCLMCKDAPCSLACKKGNPARFLRAIRFGNEKFALSWIKDCTAKDLENAERECIHYDRPVRIREVVNALQKDAFKLFGYSADKMRESFLPGFLSCLYELRHGGTCI